MIFLAVFVLVGYLNAKSAMGDCDGRTVGLHRECSAVAGPLVPGQTLTPPRVMRFGVDMADPRLSGAPSAAVCAANPYRCD